jgi:hypothetical protein
MMGDFDWPSSRSSVGGPCGAMVAGGAVPVGSGMRRGSMRVEHEPLTTVSDPDRSFLGWYPWTLCLAQVMIADRR